MLKQPKVFLKPLKFAFLISCLAAVVFILMPNYYQSEARILPVEQKGLGGLMGGLGGLSAAAATLGVALPGSEGSDANFVDVLQSRWMAEQILATEFTFKARAWRFGPESERRTTLYSYLKARNIDRAVRKYLKIFHATRDLKTKVVRVTAETRSPDLSQQIVIRSVRLLEQFVQAKGRTKGGAKAIFAEARLKEARNDMDRAEGALRQFVTINRNYQSSGDPAVRLQGLRLEAELKFHQGLVMTLAVAREQALMEEKNDIPIVNLLDPGNLPEEKSRPARSWMVLGVFLASFATLLGWFNRDDLLEVLRAD